jgi:hypothetical protein
LQDDLLHGADALMSFLDAFASPVFLMALALLLTLLALRARQRHGARRTVSSESLDTVQSWPPRSARVLSTHERQAYELLRRSLPGFLVLAQVPLARFLRVPTRHSYGDWLRRVGSLSADLLLCDSGSRVLAVIDIRPAEETSRARRRHERLSRVLTAAGIKVHVWREGDFPSLSQVRNRFASELATTGPDVPKPSPSRPMPLIPVADMNEVLSPGDQAAYDAAMEPVPSAFFDEMETDAAQMARG